MPEEKKINMVEELEIKDEKSHHYSQKEQEEVKKEDWKEFWKEEKESDDNN